jgi:hypothetical protein
MEMALPTEEAMHDRTLYRLTCLAVALYRAGRVGPGFWALVSGGGAAFVAEAEAAPRSCRRSPTS